MRATDPQNHGPGTAGRTVTSSRQHRSIPSLLCVRAHTPGQLQGKTSRVQICISLARNTSPPSRSAPLPLQAGLPTRCGTRNGSCSPQLRAGLGKLDNAGAQRQHRWDTAAATGRTDTAPLGMQRRFQKSRAVEKALQSKFKRKIIAC